MIGGLMSIDRAMNYFIDLTLLKIDRYKGLTILKINFYDKIWFRHGRYFYVIIAKSIHIHY